MESSNSFILPLPITSNISAGFEKFADVNHEVRLYMIYQSGDQWETVKKMVNESDALRNSVKLIGKIEHHELAYWYSAASFYISGSHRDATNYALLEAMACGCIPVVTDISSFKKMTAAGRYGFLYSPGNENALTAILNDLKNINVAVFSGKIQNHFNENLSFKNIADDLYYVFTAIAD